MVANTINNTKYKNILFFEKKYIFKKKKVYFRITINKII